MITFEIKQNRQQPGEFSYDEMEKIATDVRTAAYKIIDAKKATYYGIGIALTRITRAILGNENSVLTVSAKLHGEYGQKDVYAGVPCVVNRHGIERVIELNLEPEELEKMQKSCDVLREYYQGL